MTLGSSRTIWPFLASSFAAGSATQSPIRRSATGADSSGIAWFSDGAIQPLEHVMLGAREATLCAQPG